MTLESLLLSRDAEVVRVLRPTLEKLSIDVEICQEAKKAAEILIAEKFDAVIIDCDDLRGGLEVLQGLRATPSNKSSVTFAVLNGKKTTTQEAFAMGVNFVLQKPITPVNAARCFHAALNFMVRERRRYYRHPVKMLVKIVAGEKEIKGSSTDLSEGGMALQLHQAIPKNATPRVHFTLPETSLSLDLEAEVAWADLKGRVGLRFRNVAPGSQEHLEKWLNQQMQKKIPDAKDAAGAGSEAVQ
ncbi:MAG TPA: PilZ domain-containing protein [Candidatus Acidoferrum sp.]|nr:PilZ domain-containing protein [Candidatus Acidoferrum sp.]